MSIVAKKTKPIQSAALFRTVSAVLDKETGVKLGEKQEPMIASRLTRRMIDLGLSEENQYLSYLSKHLDQESKILVSLLTTHHTFFFREFTQFEYLSEQGLKQVVENARKRGEKKIRVWSAACSRGQEAYSLSMFLKLHLKSIASDFTYEIYGTDVCAESVGIARNAVYPWNEIKSLPSVYLEGNWARGKDEISAFVRANESIRSACHFDIGNLITLENEPVSIKYDLIFCRNVFIYFSKEQIESSTRALLARLEKNGYLFLGTTETLRSYGNLPVESVGPSIYRIKDKNSAPQIHPSTVSSSRFTTPSAPVLPLPRKIKVMCVDDSPVIHSLMKQVLTADAGFEIVATAINGKDAIEKLKNIAVDVITLDIHMPEMNGIEFLERQSDKSRPPVVMISSVSREDASLAIRALALGAVDYVEKPELSHLSDRSDEIRTKLWHAVHTHLKKGSHAERSTLRLTDQEKWKPENASDSLLTVFCSLSDRNRLDTLIRELRQQTPFPTTVVLVEGSESILEAMAPQLGVRVWKPGIEKLLPSQVYIADLKKSLKPLQSEKSWRKTCGLLINEPSSASLQKITQWKSTRLIVNEELKVASARTGELFSMIQDRVPVTSFAYLAFHYLLG